MVFEIFDKYINSPMMVAFSMKEMHIQEIPFPAVTICPRAKISLSYFNMTDIAIRRENRNISTEELRIRDIASTVCEFYSTEETPAANSTEEDFFYQFLLNSSFPVLSHCWYKQDYQNCSEIFTPVLTEDGICYSFNILDKHDIYKDSVYFRYPDFHSSPRSNWNEQGYTGKNVSMYPRRSTRHGAKNGLFVLLTTRKSDLETECSGGETGYKVTLNLPSKLPDVQENFINVPLDKTVSGIIIPRVVRTSKGVEKIALTKRDCYFPTERKLKYFKIYNQDNCILECKTNHTLEQCNCSGIHMPKELNTRTCLLDDIICMEDIDYFIAMANDVLDYEYKGKINISKINDCNCLPSCSDTNYDLEISHSEFYRKHVTNASREIYDDSTYYYSKLQLYFKKNRAETKERTQVYGFTDVISNFGGLLSLFTGFSVLSFAEIIYFLTLRMWGNFRLYGTWHGQENLKSN